MNLNLQNKVAIISGGAKGIGAAITRLFKQEGAIPIILDIDKEAGIKLIEEIKSGDFIEADLKDEKQCKKAIAFVIKKYGNIDILINNAAVSDDIGLDASNDEFVASLHRNLIHYFTLTKLCWNSLKNSKGAIINVASKVAVVGQGKTSGYAASKGGVLALTREWAVEGLSHGIRVNAVVPAEVFTDMYEKWLSKQSNPIELKKKIESRIPLGKRMTTPEEIAKSVLYLASDMSSHTTGEFLFPDGGYVHLDNTLFD